MILIILLTISPYLIRNMVVIDTITITKSLGYNLWKGNNPNSLVEGGVIIDENLRKEINNIPKDKFYGINFNNFRNFFSNLLRFQWHCSSQNHSRGRKNLHGQSTGDGRNSRPGYENPAHTLAIHPLQSLERLLYALPGRNKILQKGG